jgi:phospho-N-acetylmuramoyl-pentapeptide-transferase
MGTANILPLALGLIIFSFLITSILVVPFIDLLYKLKITRRKQAPKKGKIPLIDKLQDHKAGTPVGGGILIIAIVTALYAAMFPLIRYMGVYIESAFGLREELFILFFTFLSFGLLGLSDDLVKIFGKGVAGRFGMWIGLRRKPKFIFQWILAIFIAYYLYNNLGIHILHVPLLDKTLDLGFWYVPFAALLIVTFTNAYNITDGLDGLASGLLMIFLIAFGAIAATSLDVPLALFITMWLGSLMAFLYFNVWPARMFLGDAGALSFGATLAIIGLITGSIFALIIIGAIFLIEIASSAIQIFGWRVLNKPIFPLAGNNISTSFCEKVEIKKTKKCG